MTHLLNRPEDFAPEALAGLAAAHPDLLRLVHGGVVRAEPLVPGQVAVVVGGGTGHHPAFAGWVGPGFAAGAVCGGVFASPSASQIRSVARAAAAGGGVLLGYGNYAGDVLNFGLAAERLRAEGLDTRELAVTDDIASAPAEQATRRRGIAGDLVVLKILCAAAQDGLDLDGVERVGRAANAATRTFGVALSGCTLPGAEHPLFTLPPGRMGVGMGIHGEPGLREVDLGTADEVAELLTEGVLAEEPARGQGGAGYQGRVAVLVNGLGSTTAEELFVVYRAVARTLVGRGLVLVRPEVGQRVASLDMAGVSLTVGYLTEELERYWLAAVQSPEYRRPAGVSPQTSPAPVPVPPAPEPAGAPVQGSPASRQAASRVVQALAVVRQTVAEHADRWGDVDAVAGDGDHGIGMSRGAVAAADTAAAVARAGAGAGGVLLHAGEAWAEAGGGTSGALWGVALTAFGRRLGDSAPVGAQQVADGVGDAVQAVVRLGGAQVGDKTMVDAAEPFARELAAGVQRGLSLAQAWTAAARAGAAAAQATAQLTARRGRAQLHGERSLGTPDAGALSFATVVTALGAAAGWS